MGEPAGEHGAAGLAFELGREIAPAEQPARLDAMAAAIRRRTELVPRVGLVLGSGLGGLADAVEVECSIGFAEVPGWPPATAPGHAGRLVMGRLAGVPVVVQQGRFHLYEGHSGGVKPAFGAGTLMVIADHLNLTGRSPLVGANAPEIGPRFPDMTTVWDADLRSRFHVAARAEGVAMAEGVYACLLGPSYETPAEVRMLGRLGADAVGMSTALEAVAARWAGMRVCGVSLVTNPGAGLSGAELSHAEVLAAAESPNLQLREAALQLAEAIPGADVIKSLAAVIACVESGKTGRMVKVARV